MFNREAIAATAARLGRTEAEIEAALKIEAEYRRDVARVKNKQNEIAASASRDRARRQYAADNPDWCLCDEFGFDHGQDPERDEVVDHITVRSRPGFEPVHALQEPVYRCPLCGRKYVPRILMAGMA